GQTHALAQERLVHLLHEYLGESSRVAEADISAALIADYRATGGRSQLRFETTETVRDVPRPRRSTSTPSRQARHLQV
ncbi:MAG: hypothetical protein ABI127_05020, partial [Dokdonella sp.]